MANNWYFAFDNAPLSEALQEKLNMYGILKSVPKTNVSGSSETRFVKDFFTPDGYPRLNEGVKLEDVSFPYIFPAIAPWYDGAAIPSAIVKMDPLYRQTACEASLSWLFNLMGAAKAVGSTKNSRTFHGLSFQEEIHGVTHTFAFPDTRIEAMTHGGTAAVVLIADSYWNNGEWEKQGSVPLYARQQAMFQLWCWDQFGNKVASDSHYTGDIPTKAFIVRICGDLAADCTIRTVEYNRKEAQELVNRICKARIQEPQRGLYWKRNIEAPQTWAEKVENEAFVTDDEDLYDLVVAYMKARSARKNIERELNDVVSKRDGIAVHLASCIPATDLQGTMALADGTHCTVTHQLKRASRKTVAPDLVRSFFPALEEFIVASGQERTTVTIDVL